MMKCIWNQYGVSKYLWASRSSRSMASHLKREKFKLAVACYQCWFYSFFRAFPSPQCKAKASFQFIASFPARRNLHRSLMPPAFSLSSRFLCSGIIFCSLQGEIEIIPFSVFLFTLPLQCKTSMNSKHISGDDSMLLAHFQIIPF